MIFYFNYYLYIDVFRSVLFYLRIPALLTEWDTDNLASELRNLPEKIPRHLETKNVRIGFDAIATVIGKKVTAVCFYIVGSNLLPRMGKHSGRRRCHLKIFRG